MSTDKIVKKGATIADLLFSIIHPFSFIFLSSVARNRTSLRNSLFGSRIIHLSSPLSRIPLIINIFLRHKCCYSFVACFHSGGTLFSCVHCVRIKPIVGRVAKECFVTSPYNDLERGREIERPMQYCGHSRIRA